MTMHDLSVQDLIPHRGRMKLVETIIHVEAETATTRSTVNREWPLEENGSVSPLVLIELTAQTAGIATGWEESVIKGKKIDGQLGWLVGIKQADFHINEIAVGTRITVHTKKSFSLETYQEVTGTAKIDQQVIGEITLQIFHPDTEDNHVHTSKD